MAMWSERFAADERASRPTSIVFSVVAVSGVALAGCALLADVIFAVLVAGRELTTRGGSWVVGLLSLGLGFAGPYAAIRMWWSPSGADERMLRRVARVASVTLTVAVLALAWLLLIHSGQRPQPKV